MSLFSRRRYHNSVSYQLLPVSLTCLHSTPHPHLKSHSIAVGPVAFGPPCRRPKAIIARRIHLKIRYCPEGQYTSVTHSDDDHSIPKSGFVDKNSYTPYHQINVSLTPHSPYQTFTPHQLKLKTQLNSTQLKPNHNPTTQPDSLFQSSRLSVARIQSQQSLPSFTSLCIAPPLPPVRLCTSRAQSRRFEQRSGSSCRSPSHRLHHTSHHLTSRYPPRIEGSTGRPKYAAST